MEPESLYDVILAEPGKNFVKAWRRGVSFEEEAVKQLLNTARLSFVWPYVAAMPDCHLGIGATVGSVVPTLGAVIPAAVGVDIGCGMMAARLDITLAEEPILSSNLPLIRREIEAAVPHGRTCNGGPGDEGAWQTIPEHVRELWRGQFEEKFEALCAKHPGARNKNTVSQLGTLGTGNHFIELSLDEEGFVWVVLHSGSRGMGNRIGTYFIQLAKALCEKWFIELPDRDLAYLPAGTEDFGTYMGAVNLAQRYAWNNRELMMAEVLKVLGSPSIRYVVHCHHNYVSTERHFNKEVLITRKGAVRAGLENSGIIPGSMGARTFIVRGKGSRHSFESCSHGAGRSMSRTKARQTFTVEQHVAATEGIECEKGDGVLDETPGAYKDIAAVMAAQADLVSIEHTLTPLLCVKGLGEARK